MSFSGNEINWPLCFPVHTDQKTWSRPDSSSIAISSSCQIRCLITLWVESSIISIDSSITDNIIRKVINVCKKIVGPRMGPWLTPAFTEPLSALYYWEKKRNKAKYLTQNTIRLNFVKKTSIPKPIKSFEYIKCYSSSDTAWVGPELLKALAV